MNSTYAQKSSTVQKATDSNAASVLDSSAQNESLQRKADMANSATQRAEAPRPNNTGLPDNLKSGIERLSGFSMDDVRVHYNSSKPATVQAFAYTQGTDIHVAPGQEKYLPHEAWHVAQQMAGRVSPTTNINGMPVNDNEALEHEADVMGEKAVQCKNAEGKGFVNKIDLKKTSQLKLDPDRLNVVGENHVDSEPRRENEKKFVSAIISDGHYWMEHEFKTNKENGMEYGDPIILKILDHLERAKQCGETLETTISMIEKMEIVLSNVGLFIGTNIFDAYACISYSAEQVSAVAKHFSKSKDQYLNIENLSDLLENFSDLVPPLPREFAKDKKSCCDILEVMKESIEVVNNVTECVEIVTKNMRERIMSVVPDESCDNIVLVRSVAMHNAANSAYQEKGVWKVGMLHVKDIKRLGIKPKYNLVSKDEFNREYEDWWSEIPSASADASTEYVDTSEDS